MYHLGRWKAAKTCQHCLGSEHAYAWALPVKLALLQYLTVLLLCCRKWFGVCYWEADVVGFVLLMC